MTFNQNISSEAVRESVSALKAQLQKQLDGVFKQEVVKISAAGLITLKRTNNEILLLDLVIS